MKDLQGMNTSIVAAHEAYRNAALVLTESVRKAFPVGCIVHVTMGNARIVAEVVGHSDSWWYDPAEVYIVNKATGKRRNFSATYAGHQPSVEKSA